NTVAGTSSTKSETITNKGGAPLTIDSLSVVDDASDPTFGAHASSFTLTSPPTLPMTLEPGDSLIVPVEFTPTGTGPQGAALQLGTSDPQDPAVSVVLRGLGTAGEGGKNEPSLQWILATRQIPVDTGTDDASTVT